MAQNIDFFTENDRFRLLIKHYARKLGSVEYKADLWSFLREILHFKNNLEDRYIAVCLRNKYIEISKKRSKTENVLPLEIDIPDNENDIDLEIDLKTAVATLPHNEKRVILQHFYDGKTFEEIAKEVETSRQRQYQICNRGVLRLREMLKVKKR